MKTKYFYYRLKSIEGILEAKDIFHAILLLGTRFYLEELDYVKPASKAMIDKFIKIKEG